MKVRGERKFRTEGVGSVYRFASTSLKRQQHIATRHECARHFDKYFVETIRWRVDDRVAVHGFGERGVGHRSGRQLVAESSDRSTDASVAALILTPTNLTYPSAKPS